MVETQHFFFQSSLLKISATNTQRMSDKKLILVRGFQAACLSFTDHILQVTGVTGFIAGHVADQLLTAGYRVRGSVFALRRRYCD
jgi:hypothetical protein